ncbi:DgyrCDS14918 [Dimorphilus gyrociliatus]|uniref:DgyrCDS14918 n=1 Tax=Dimorphilus gyrociliatus TaxID=2664684 RepID=A0A7I8WFB6_9ANNE|nr:DgyrCDS14918 [Dimorphilus gyrociliatus]
MGYDNLHFWAERCHSGRERRTELFLHFDRNKKKVFLFKHIRPQHKTPTEFCMKCYKSNKPHVFGIIKKIRAKIMDFDHHSHYYSNIYVRHKNKTYRFERVKRKYKKDVCFESLFQIYINRRHIKFEWDKSYKVKKRSNGKFKYTADDDDEGDDVSCHNMYFRADIFRQSPIFPPPSHYQYETPEGVVNIPLIYTESYGTVPMLLNFEYIALGTFPVDLCEKANRTYYPGLKKFVVKPFEKEYWKCRPLFNYHLVDKKKPVIYRCDYSKMRLVECFIVAVETLRVSGEFVCEDRKGHHFQGIFLFL